MGRKSRVHLDMGGGFGRAVRGGGDGARRDRDIFRVVALVGATREVEIAHLLDGSRGSARVAGARQLAMYLCHVMLGRTYTEVGDHFGRDRTTVAHACAVVEDLRDDLGIDADITALEARITDDAMPVAAWEAQHDARR